MGGYHGLLLANWMSAVGVSGGGDMESATEDSGYPWHADECGVGDFEMDEMKVQF